MTPKRRVINLSWFFLILSEVEFIPCLSPKINVSIQSSNVLNASKIISLLMTVCIQQILLNKNYASDLVVNHQEV